METLDNLGDNVYQDRYIVDQIIKNCQKIDEKALSDKLGELLEKSNFPEKILANIIDICIECDAKIFDEKMVKDLLQKYAEKFSIVASLLEYSYYFKLSGLKSQFLLMLSQAYPDNIKLQITELCFYLSEGDSYILDQIKAQIKQEANQEVYLDYLDFLLNGFSLTEEGLTIVQAMFYGNIDDKQGTSGGLEMLLKTLGNALGESEKTGNVLTLKINNNWDDGKKIFMQQGENHWLVRLPLYLDKDDKLIFLKKELVI